MSNYDLKGLKIRLTKMIDPFGIPIGTIGIIDHTDDIGNIIVKWENGRTLSLVPGEDEYEILD